MPLVLLLLFALSAHADSCMGPNGPFDCGQLEQKLKEYGHYTPKPRKVCRVLLSVEVAYEADTCLKMKKEDACSANSVSCYWDRHKNRCDGRFIRDCERRANSSQAGCDSIEWFAQEKWPCVQKPTENCYRCRNTIGGTLEKYFSKKIRQ